MARAIDRDQQHSGSIMIKKASEILQDIGDSEAPKKYGRRLSPFQAEMIRAMHGKGMMAKDLAKIYGVSEITVWRIWRYSIWGSVGQ